MNFCKAFKALPRAGGIEDQDPATIEKFRIIANLQSEKDRIDMEKRQRAHERRSQQGSG